MVFFDTGLARQHNVCGAEAVAAERDFGKNRNLPLTRFRRG
jgi:hypothetical protein